MQYSPIEDDATDSDVSILSPDDIRDYNPDQILPQSAKTIKKIRDWLKPTPYDVVGGEFRKHLLSHAPGTGDWLTSSATYQEWLHGQDHGLLWIRGIPGSGKSVMAARLVDELAKLNPGCPVLYFFFRQIIDANHEPQALLRDWMDQILNYSPPLQNQLLKYVNDGRTTKSISMEDMWRDLRTALSSLPGNVFCIADALDEMDQGNDTFLQTLGSLGQFMPAKVKVLITSRPVPSVEGPLRKTSGLHVRLQENLVDIDISNYVDLMLAKSSIPESNWKVIQEAVPGRANGLFLYAKLAMDAFLEPDADIKSVIGQLPVDLNALYTDLLNEHAKRSGVDPRVQHLILQVVTHATRPLRLLELTDLVMVANPDENVRTVKDTKSLIRAACGPLLEILADETVSVIHHSFTEYLKGTTRTQDSSGYPVLSIGTTHAQLALACLHYLQSGCLDESEDAEDDKYADRSTQRSEQRLQSRLKYPFLEYAAYNWYHHARQSDNAGHSQTEINVQIRNFLSLGGKIRNWLPMEPYELPEVLGSYLHLHVPAEIGLISYFREALANDVPASQEHRKWAVRRAAKSGHASIVQELIAAGTEPDADDGAGLKPLHYAAEKNHHEVVRVLLEAGVNPLTPKTKNEPWTGCMPPPNTLGDTPLMYACRNGHKETVMVLLDFIEDAETKEGALGWVSGAGRSEIVTTILQDPGIDINAKSKGTTPLWRACSNPDASTIKSLLLAGADPNIHCQPGSNSSFGVYLNAMDRIARPEDPGLDSTQAYVSAAARQKNPNGEELSSVVSLLKQAGAEFHKRDHQGRTLLHLAVQSPLLTAALLDAGVDANLKDEKGETPLHNDDIEDDCMTLLIEKGHADINATRNDGKSILMSYLSSYKSRARQLLGKLFDYGPDCNVVDKEGNGPLHVLLNDSSPSLDTIEQLLRGGADVNLRNHKGQTPLIYSRYPPSEEVISRLSKAGADINAVDYNGATLLFRSISSESKYLEMLLSQGASFKTQDFKGRSLFHEYVKCHIWRERTDSFPYLLSQGLDIHAVDNDGNNLLHELALTEDAQSSYHGEEAIRFWERLVEMRVDSDLKNYAGRTPLHLLCAGQPRIEYGKYGKHKDITLFDFVLPRVKNVDVADNEGVTPLHIAATASERYSTRLIAAGADPSRPTNEGLTPLHIAARCRASNIVGRLLDALRAKDRAENSAYSSGLDNDGEKPRPVMGVNEQPFGRETRSITPLFYACRSGTPETVRLLLDAGATIDLRQMLDATLQFEEECALWRTPCQPSTCDDVPVKLDSRFRRKRTDTKGSYFYHLIPEQVPRLDEIWGMIASHLTNVSDIMLDAIHHCIMKASLAGQGYTASVLSEVRRKWQSKTLDWKMMNMIEDNNNSQKQDQAKALKLSGTVTPGGANKGLMDYYLSRREYHLVEEMVHLGCLFLPVPGESEENCLADLVANGYSSLFEKVAESVTASVLQSGLWHAYGDNTKPGLWFAAKDISESSVRGSNPKPLIVTAVQRGRPNMVILQLLVERFGVDIDELHYDRDRVAADSALHSLARSTSWWHTQQALPYLIKAGADLNIRNYLGQTPLHIALKASNREVAISLIEAGADVSAADKEDKNCLSYAQEDAELSQLLLARGANTSVNEIFAAIEASDVEALKRILSRNEPGINANSRQVRSSDEDADRRKRKRRKKKPRDYDCEEEKDYVLDDQLFPLFYAGVLPTNMYRKEDADKIVKVLLDFNADPFAKFLSVLAMRRSKAYDRTYDTPSIEVPEDFRECTLAHELFLRHRGRYENLVLLPALDVNHRDCKGRTLLHVACITPRGPDSTIKSEHGDYASLFERLVRLGADLKARDNQGRNVLHHMLHNLGSGNFEKSFLCALEACPELIQQADDDGRTPLLEAAIYAADTNETEPFNALLEAGADCFTVDKNGESCLHKLAENLLTQGLRDHFRDLVKRGVDINGVNSSGETPLFVFSRRPSDFFTKRYYDMKWYPEKYSEKDALPLLLKLGADLTVANNKGQGLLHAAASGDVDRFKELMDAGADAIMEDEAQRTALDIAAASDNQEVLALFERKS